MSFLESLNRHFERNQVVTKALSGQYDQLTITDIDDFDSELWMAIKKCRDEQWRLEIIKNESTSLEFLVRIFIKIGFCCEDGIKLMMHFHKNGKVVIAKADQNLLVNLQEYLRSQSKRHKCELTTILTTQ